MHSKSKLLVLFVTAVIITLTVLTGFVLAAAVNSKLSVALDCFPGEQCRSCVKDLVLVSFASLILLLRALLVQEQQ